MYNYITHVIAVDSIACIFSGDTIQVYYNNLDFFVLRYNPKYVIFIN